MQNMLRMGRAGDGLGRAGGEELIHHFATAGGGGRRQRLILKGGSLEKFSKTYFKRGLTRKLFKDLF